MRTNDLVKFIEARERHREAKERGYWNSKAKPDPIISQYRFCNVRRNDDRVTKFIHDRFFDYRKWRGDPTLWFALVVARLFNNEDTLRYIDDTILPFRPAVMKKLLHERVKLGFKNFNAAYIVSTNGIAKDKVDYLIDDVLTPLWRDRKIITADLNVGQLANCQLVLTRYKGLGSFMAAQVLADLKYARPAKWDDFHTFAASGPGSRRGLNRVMGRKTGEAWPEATFRATLAKLRDAVNARLKMEPLTAQDVQNCLCEFDKYERVLNNEGLPKQLYKPKGN